MMANAAVRIEFDAGPILRDLEQIESNFRKLQMLEYGVKSALVPVRNDAARLAPAPGQPGYTYPSKGSKRAGRKRLRDTMGVRTKIYSASKVLAGVVGPQYPAGAHGHLVEHGHRVVTGGSTRRVGRWNKRGLPNAGVRTGKGTVIGYATPKPFLSPAVENNRSTVNSIFVAATSKRIASELRRLARG